MALQRRQKFIIHHYARAAGLPEAMYRRMLRVHAGVGSAADPYFSQQGFDRLMAAFETVLFQKVDRGQVEDPRGNDRWIHNEFYWRNRLPQPGFINTRQAHRIRILWKQLQDYLPPEKRSVAYLARIIHKATGKANVGYQALKFWEAEYLIDALTDRLSYAARKTPAHMVHQLEDVAC